MKRVYIIAEAGVNHNGSEELALQLIEVAAKAGADAVKFQTFKAEALVAKGTATAAYQKSQTGSDDQFSMLKALEMSSELHVLLLAHCKLHNIEFMSTPFDLDSAEFLVNLGMRIIKIPSGELTNLPLISKLAAYDLPMILSTGMATLSEVKDAINAVRSIRQELCFERPLDEVLTILHCTSNYPAADADVNLRAITTLESECGLPAGYSDHTSGIVVSVAAVAMGAKVIEKHFTLDKELPGPDHKASLMPDELTEMVSQIRRVERCLGDGVKEPKSNELPIRELVRRSVVLARDKKGGDTLQPDDLVLLRPGTGIPPKDLPALFGRKLSSSKYVGELLGWDDLAL